MVKFFVNLLAAIYGLIGFFSIIPFLLLISLFGFSLAEPSQADHRDDLILILVLGWTSSLGISIIYMVNRFNDLGRKLMIVYSMSILSLFLGVLWRGKIGSRVLTFGNHIALGIVVIIFIGVTLFLFHSKVRQFFRT